MLPTSKLKIWSRQMRLYKWHIKNRKEKKGKNHLNSHSSCRKKCTYIFIKNLSIKKPLSAVNEHQVTIEPDLVVQLFHTF